MEIIYHRRNTIDELINTPQGYGIEIDLRSWNGSIILHHEPFEQGTYFEEWLREYNHGTLILNVKEEGLENTIISLMEMHEIENYFFLDMSFPFIIKISSEGNTKIAARFSEYESVETVLSLKNKIEWVWVDCFNQTPFVVEEYHKIKETNLKICIVSPELTGRSENHDFDEIKSFFENNNITIDAVCTKTPEVWE